MARLEIVVASRDPELGGSLSKNARVRVVGQVTSPAEIAAAVETHHPSALVVDLAGDPNAVFHALDKLLQPRPKILFRGPDDSQLILRALRFGGCEYVAPGPDAEAQFSDAIDRMILDLGQSDAADRGAVISVSGAKGGVGTSFLACQLAAALCGPKTRSVIVDGQMRHGDVAVYLDLKPRFTIANIALRTDPLDSTYLDTALEKHASGLRVLAAPSRIEEAEGVTVETLDSVFGLLRNDFDWIVCDTPEDFDEKSLFFLDKADVNVLVTTPDVPSLNHTKMKVELLERLGTPKDRIRIVLNREDRKAPVSRKDAQEFLERDVEACIPNDFARASGSVNEGRTLEDMAPNSALARSIKALSRRVCVWSGRQPPETEAKRGLFERMRGK